MIVVTTAPAINLEYDDFSLTLSASGNAYITNKSVERRKLADKVPDLIEKWETFMDDPERNLAFKNPPDSEITFFHSCPMNRVTLDSIKSWWADHTSTND